MNKNTNTNNKKSRKQKQNLTVQIARQIHIIDTTERRVFLRGRNINIDTLLKTQVFVQFTTRVRLD